MPQNTPKIDSDHESFISKLRSVIDITSGSVGDDYFKCLAEELSKAFNVEYVFISETFDDYRRIRSLAYWHNHELAENIEYDAADTPCGECLKNDITFYPSNLRQHFPLDMDLIELEAESYFAMPFRDTDGKILGLICLLGTKPMDKSIYDEYLLKIISTRISAEYTRKKAEQELMHIATHDALTGIPNKMLFWDRINTTISRATRNNKKFGLLFVDLDNFKKINDSYGHHKGDCLLVDISKRLINSCRKTDTISRFGGDEFVIIIEGIKDSDDISNIANMLYHKTIDTEYMIDDIKLQAEISIGAAIFPDHGENSKILLQHADEAMYSAKTSHMPYQLYGDEISTAH